MQGGVRKGNTRHQPAPTEAVGYQLLQKGQKAKQQPGSYLARLEARLKALEERVAAIETPTTKYRSWRD